MDFGNVRKFLESWDIDLLDGNRTISTHIHRKLMAEATAMLPNYFGSFIAECFDESHPNGPAIECIRYHNWSDMRDAWNKYQMRPWGGKDHLFSLEDKTLLLALHEAIPLKTSAFGFIHYQFDRWLGACIISKLISQECRARLLAVVEQES